jgi:CDP-diacylglycerol--glycerol-3-phosphate 3-phosphatidyltransferase
MAQTNANEPKSAEPQVLTDKLRGYAKAVIDPIVTFLAKYKISPDVLTVLGMLFHFFFAWLIALGEFRWAAVAMLFLSPLDALDGSLARKMGRKQGGFGAFLDSTLDRLAEIILFGGFIYYYWLQENVTMMAVSYLAVTGSIMVSYARSKAESLGYNSKVGIASRVERYAAMIILLFLNMPDLLMILLAITTYFTLFQRGYHVWKQWIAEMRAEEADKI